MSWFAELLGPFRGFAVTFRQMFRPRVTNKYPAEKRRKPQRFHGRHVLNRYPDGMEKCIGCELCAGVCPARCIYVRGKENPVDDPVSPGERYGYVYEINMLRCIFCGLCVEACPTEAITMTHLFEMSVTSREDSIYTRDELLVEPDGTPNHPQQAGPLIDLDELKIADGWMRATSPSGRAAYEGVVAWSPSAGADVRPPEKGQMATPYERPGSRVEIPDELDVETPEPGESRETEGGDTGGTQDPGSRTQDDPGSEIQDPRSRDNERSEEGSP